MPSEGLLVYFSQNWPEMLASGALIPGVQFVSSQIWQLRRRSRLAAIRKEIVETDEFLSRYTSESSLNPAAAQALPIYREERQKMFEEVQRLATPFHVSHPGAARFLSFLLISRPRYAISLLTRMIFFVALYVFFRDLARILHGGDNWDTVWAAAIDAVAFHYLTTAVEGVSGRITTRPWWQRLTLAYQPKSIFVAVFHVLFWLASLVFIVEAIRYHTGARPSDLARAFTLIFGILAVVLWWFAVHLDREIPPVIEMSQATAV